MYAHMQPERYSSQTQVQTHSELCLYACGGSMHRLHAVLSVLAFRVWGSLKNVLDVAGVKVGRFRGWSLTGWVLRRVRTGWAGSERRCNAVSFRVSGLGLTVGDNTGKSPAASASTPNESSWICQLFLFNLLSFLLHRTPGPESLPDTP